MRNKKRKLDSLEIRSNSIRRQRAVLLPNAMAPPRRKGFALSGGANTHGNSSDNRHAVFAAWVTTHLLPPPSPPTDGSADAAAPATVVDVGGGKGALSKCFTAQGLRCVLIDPWAVVGRAVHDPARVLDAPARRDLESSLGGELVVVCATLEAALERDAALLNGVDAVVGLHPDEATEAIMDCAMAHSLPFAVHIFLLSRCTSAPPLTSLL